MLNNTRSRFQICIFHPGVQWINITQSLMSQLITLSASNLASCLQDVVLSDVASFQTLHECISWFLGIQGPVIVTQARERVVIHFKNLAAQPYSISPVGISYWKQSEGELSHMLTFCRNHVLVHFLT